MQSRSRIPRTHPRWVPEPDGCRLISRGFPHGAAQGSSARPVVHNQPVMAGQAKHPLQVPQAGWHDRGFHPERARGGEHAACGALGELQAALNVWGGPRRKGWAPAFGECKGQGLWMKGRMVACARRRLTAAAGLRSWRSPGGSGALGTLCCGARGTLGHGTGPAVAWLCSSWLGTALFNEEHVYLGWGLTPEVSGPGNVPPWCPHADPPLLPTPSISLNGMKVSRPDIRIGRYRMIKHERDKHNEPNPQR